MIKKKVDNIAEGPSENFGVNGGQMKKRIGFMLLLFLFCFFQSGYAAERTPAKGESFPDIALPIPVKADYREYLGLTGKGQFKISHIKADVVIVEIFSMYCPYCQREAPNINELYKLISQKNDLKHKIKIINAWMAKPALL